MQTQAQNQQAANVAKAVEEKEKKPEDEVVKTSFEEILLEIPATIAEEGEVEMLDAPAPTEETTSSTEMSIKKPTLEDLLESAKRRKRRSSGAPPSPLASNPPELESEGTAALSLQKALDDFELDVKKGLGRASELFRWGRRGSKGDEETGR